MRNGILATLLLVCAVVNASALHPAPDTDRKTIQLLIDVASLQQDDIDKAQKVLDALTHQLKDYPKDQQLQQQALEKSRDIASSTKERDLDRDKAIHYALIAYGIVPADASDKPQMPSGASVEGPYAGRRISWKPIAQDNKGYPMSLPNGKHEDYPINETADLGGITFPDGMTSIFAFSFQSPELLAVILSHEKDHFDQRTTPGRGDKMSLDEMEVETWKKTLGDLSLVGFSDQDRIKWSDRAVATRDYYKKEVACDHSLVCRLLTPKKPGNPDFGFHDPQELHGIEARFDDLNNIVAQEIHDTREATQRQNKEEANAKLREMLAGIVEKACVDGLIGQEELDALPAPSDPNFWNRMPKFSDNCERGLFMSLGSRLGRGDRLTLGDIQNLMPSGGNPALSAGGNPEPLTPAAAAHPPTNHPAIDASEYRRQWTAYYEAQLRNMRFLAQWDCANNGVLSSDNAQTYRTAYYSLLKNKNLEAGYRIEGYEPNTALNGLTGCASELMVEFLKYPDNDLNNNARSVLEEYYPDPVPTPLVHQPTPPPRPRPVPQPNPCFVYDGVRFCPAKPR